MAVGTGALGRRHVAASAAAWGLLLLVLGPAVGPDSLVVGADAHRGCAFDEPAINPHLRRTAPRRAAQLRAEYFAGRAARREAASSSPAAGASDQHARRYAPDKAGGVIDYQIPVYYYCLYNSSANNVTAAAFTTQTARLNTDLHMANTDIQFLDPDFNSVKSPVKITFVQAGASWHEVTSASFGLGQTASIMAEAPPTTETHLALHVYVVDLAAGFLGYAQFPRGNNATDVVVLDYNVVGDGTSNTVAPYDKGRTLVHEVGHWLGLLHPWGPSASDPGCLEGDYVLDTPATNSSSDPPVQFCSEERYSCGGVKSMPQNFMDYWPDLCMFAFTRDQATRMRGVLDDPRGWRRSLVVGGTCGDGTVDPNEECDDNNTVPDDGCTFCVEDLGYGCSGAPSSCAPLPNLVPLVSDIFGSLDPLTGLPLGWQAPENPSDFSFDNATRAMVINMTAHNRTRWVVSDNVTLPADPGAYGFGGAIVEFLLELDTEQSTASADCNDFFTFEVVEAGFDWMPLGCVAPADPAVFSDTVPRWDVNPSAYANGCRTDWTGFCTPDPSIVGFVDGFGPQWNPNLNYLDDPVRMRYDLSAWAGKTINFIFYAQTDLANPSVRVKISNFTVWADQVAIATTGTTGVPATTGGNASGTTGIPGVLPSAAQAILTSTVVQSRISAVIGFNISNVAFPTPAAAGSVDVVMTIDANYSAVNLTRLGNQVGQAVIAETGIAQSQLGSIALTPGSVIASFTISPYLAGTSATGISTSTSTGDSSGATTGTAEVDSSSVSVPLFGIIGACATFLVVVVVGVLIICFCRRRKGKVSHLSDISSMDSYDSDSY